LGLGRRRRGKDFEEKFMIELRGFSSEGFSEKFIGQVAQDTVVTQCVLGQSVHELVGHQLGISRLGESVFQVLEQLGGKLRVEIESESDPAGNGQELWVSELVSESLIAT
jgi:hypothetical protein